MMPFGKISQMSRAIVQKSHTCKHVPLTAAFDCASPNSRINYILNQWSYARQEKKRQKQRIKAEKQKRTNAKYELHPLPDYSKKIVEAPKAATKSLASDPHVKRNEYINLKGNKRISPEFLAILKQNSKEMDERIKLMEPIRVNTTSPNLDYANNEWENLNPKLAKYLRETMERNDLMRELYDVDFYDSVDTQGLKQIMNILNRSGDTSALTPQQLAKLRAYLQMSFKQSPEEFERQLQLLRDGGFLNGAMVDYIRNLLMENGGQLSNNELQNLLELLENVDTQGLKHIMNILNRSGDTSALTPQQLAKLRAYLQMAFKQSPEEFELQLKLLRDGGFLNGAMVDYIRNLLKENGGQLSNKELQKLLALLEHVDKNYTRYDAQMVGGRPFHQQKKPHGGIWSLKDSLAYDQRQRRNALIYSQLFYLWQRKNRGRWDSLNEGKFSQQQATNDAQGGKSGSRHQYSFGYQNSKMNMKTSKSGGQMHNNYGDALYGNLKRGQTPESNRSRSYIRHPWETTFSPMKRRKTWQPVVEVKKRIEKYKIPPPKPEQQETESSIHALAKTENRPSKQTHLQYKSRLSAPPKLPDRHRRSSEFSLPENIPDDISLRKLIAAISFGPGTKLSSKSEEQKKLNRGKA